MLSEAIERMAGVARHDPNTGDGDIRRRDRRYPPRGEARRASWPGRCAGLPHRGGLAEYPAFQRVQTVLTDEQAAQGPGP